jgi:hypothetical protein
MLPFHHFYNLIEPKFVNDQGFYYVTVCREGVLVKEVIDDRFYFDGSKGRIVDH